MSIPVNRAAFAAALAPVFPRWRYLNPYTHGWRRKRVNLQWWSMDREDRQENLGDMISPYICNKLLAEHGLSLDSKSLRTTRLYAVGSLLNLVTPGSVIWGSGLQHHGRLRAGDLSWMRLDVRLVRGPLTQGVLSQAGVDCPSFFGDPAVLLPEFYHPDRKLPSEAEPLFVSHFLTRDKLENSVSMMTDDPFSVIDRIAAAERIITTSLHGVIIAESYGVPAVLLEPEIPGDTFKYRDWYLSTGRDYMNVAPTVREAIAMPAPPVPELSEMRSTVRATFPYDLWKNLAK